MDKIRVAIVDDNDKMVEMMDEYLGSDDEINVIGRAKNGEEAFDLIKGTSPDAVSYTHLDVYKRQILYMKVEKLEKLKSMMM